MMPIGPLVITLASATRFHGIVTQEWDCGRLPMLQSCYIGLVVSYLLLDVTVFCKPMNVSKAIIQLLRDLAFNIHNFGLSEIELKLVVGLNFTLTRRSRVDYNLELNAGRFRHFETSGNESLPMATNGNPVALLRGSIAVRLCMCRYPSGRGPAYSGPYAEAFIAGPLR